MGDSIISSAPGRAAAALSKYALPKDFDAKLGRGPAVCVEDDLLAQTAAFSESPPP
jgi:uncharacterized protein